MSVSLFLCPSLSFAAIVEGIARNRSPQQSYFCTLTISCSFHFGICALPSNPISGLLVNQAEGAFWVKQPRLLAGLTERLLSSCPEPRMHALLDWNTTSSILCGLVWCTNRTATRVIKRGSKIASLVYLCRWNLQDIAEQKIDVDLR